MKFKWKLIDTGDNNGTYYINFTGGNKIGSQNGLTYSKYDIYYEFFSSYGYSNFDDYFNASSQSTDFTQTILTDGDITNSDSDVKTSLGFSGDMFSIKLEGYFYPQTSGTNNYYFKTTSDDASLVYINNQLVVDNSGIHGPQTIESSQFPYMEHFEIKIYYGEAYSGEEFDFEWKGGDQLVILQI